QLSGPIVSGIHQIVQCVQMRDYNMALQYHSQIVNMGSFSEISSFGPSVKVFIFSACVCLFVCGVCVCFCLCMYGVFTYVCLYVCLYVCNFHNHNFNHFQSFSDRSFYRQPASYKSISD
ncbi:hypothetical protein HELRODRAFT_80297, partial [Helobdella robusta]|uniref:Uncharacterized protein n=1 Tax=Helobdella robusta TaxID=6412 RepID=T1G3Z5_HELRO